MLKYFDYFLLILPLAIIFILTVLSIYLREQYPEIFDTIKIYLYNILKFGICLRIFLYFFLPKAQNFFDGLNSLKNRTHQIRKW